MEFLKSKLTFAASSKQEPDYSSISTTEENGEKGMPVVAKWRSRKDGPFATLFVAAVVFGGLLCSIASFRLGTHFPTTQRCSAMTTAWSPAQDLIEYKSVDLQGDFYRPSKYRGAGSSVDKAWDDIWMIGGVPVRIDDSKLSSLGKDPTRNWTRIPESMGGGIAGYPQVFHLLHCLNLLRMATYMDVYSTHSFFVDHPPKVVRGHMDHCTEMLRMQIQCASEMTPILTEELPGHEFAAPDFTVQQTCKNFEVLKEWTEENVIHGAGGWDIPHEH